MAEEQVMTREAWLEERVSAFEKALDCSRDDDPALVVDKRITALLVASNREVSRRRETEAKIQLIVDAVNALAKAGH